IDASPVEEPTLHFSHLKQYVYVMRIILFYFMKYNAVEMSQNLLIFVDDFDTYAKKFEREEKERKEKCPIPEATEPTDEFQN
uniref:MRG domain-containing protein n=1 Tax=Bursaphelenchus xylophilus TaxID=6326 RepID=A0A1I7SN27_BURXY